MPFLGFLCIIQESIPKSLAKDQKSLHIHNIIYQFSVKNGEGCEILLYLQANKLAKPVAW